MYNVCINCVYDDRAIVGFLFLTICDRANYLYIVRCKLWDSCANIVYFGFRLLCGGENQEIVYVGRAKKETVI